MPDPYEVFIQRELPLNAVDLLGVTLPHTIAVATLPMHHRDPFDRMIVAQAITDGLPLVSNEALFDAYGVIRLW